MNVPRKGPSASPPVSAQAQQRGPHQYPYQGDSRFARQPNPAAVQYRQGVPGHAVQTQEELQQLRTVYSNQQLISQQGGYQTAGPHSGAGVHDLSKGLPTHVAPPQSSVQSQASSASQQGITQMMYAQNPQSQQPRAANPGYIQPQQQVRPNIRQTQPRPQLPMQSGQPAVYGAQMPLMISPQNQHFQQIQIVQPGQIQVTYTTRPGMQGYTMTQPYTVQPQPPAPFYNPQQQSQTGLYYPPQQPMYTQTQQRPVIPQQPQQPYQKRTKKMLTITDPNTGKNIMEDILPMAPPPGHSTTPPHSGSSSSRATPVGNTPPPANNDIAAQFAAQVAATLRTPLTQEQMQPGQMIGQGQMGQGPIPPGQVQGQVIGQPPAASLNKVDMVSPSPPAPGILVPVPPAILQQQLIQQQFQVHAAHLQQQSQLNNQSQQQPQPSVNQQQGPPPPPHVNAVRPTPTQATVAVASVEPAAPTPPPVVPPQVAPPVENRQSPPAPQVPPPVATKPADSKPETIVPVVSTPTVLSKSSTELSTPGARDSVEKETPTSSSSVVEPVNPAAAATAWEPTPPSDNNKLSIDTEKEVCEEKTLEAQSAPQPSIEVTPATPKDVIVKSEDVIPEPKEQRDDSECIICYLSMLLLQ